MKWWKMLNETFKNCKHCFFIPRKVWWTFINLKSYLHNVRQHSKCSFDCFWLLHKSVIKLHYNYLKLGVLIKKTILEHLFSLLTIWFLHALLFKTFYWNSKLCLDLIIYLIKYLSYLIADPQTNCKCKEIQILYKKHLSYLSIGPWTPLCLVLPTIQYYRFN